MYIKLIRWSPDISFLVPIRSGYTKEISYQHIMSDIELSIIVEKWSVNVHLDDECTFLSLFVILRLICIVGWCSCRRCLKLFFMTLLRTLFHDQVQLIYFINYCYSFTLIRILSRFYNPYVPSFFIFTITLLFILLFDNSVSFLMILTEPKIFRIFEPILYMESKWDIIEWVLLY